MSGERRRYIGHRADGAPMVGDLTDATDLTRWVGAKFRAGYRDLTVTAGLRGPVVASIGADRDGQRTWWVAW